MPKYPITECTLGAVYVFSDKDVCFVPWYWEWSYEHAVKNGALVLSYKQYKLRYRKLYHN